MIHRLTRTLIAAFVAVLVSGPAAAQVTETGTIEIVVQDASGAAVPGVTVIATAADTLTKREAVTDTEGRARLVGLAPSAGYVVTAELTGFKPARNENILVRAGQTASVRIALTVGGLTEEVQVTSESPIVDAKSATTGADITLQLTESLPTGRSYQSYLQLVPGVLPDDPQQPGNPATKSGVNYSDIGGNVGVSSDNFYYFNGINVTDPVSGTFGANLNTEIIQEQKVLTGGIPAEFVGTPGLLSSVVTKSGTNIYHGSGNYFFQNADLVADNKNSANQEFSTFDAAFTIGGPIVRDRAWAFGSYRRLEREDDVTTLDTQEFMRTVKNEQDQGYARGTYTPTLSDSISFTFLNDPTDISGRRDRNLTNARDRARVQGGDNYTLNYQRVQGNALMEAAYFVHNGAVTDLSAIREPSNTVVYRSTDSRVLTDEQRGGFGQDLINERDTKGIRGAMQYTWNRHTFKGGLEWQENENFRNTTYLDSAVQTTLQPGLAGITAQDLGTGSFSDVNFNVTNTSDFGGLINTINALPNRAQFYSVFDANGDGTITPAEMGARLTFSSPNPDGSGTVLYDRTFQSAVGPQLTSSKGLSFFVQDQVSFGRMTLNVGVRAERWEHFATTDENIFTFDWEFAPRLSAIYDLRGDGRQKLSAFWGRYYDPIRNNMTNFAGTLTGSVLEEQIYFGAPINQWATYRTRGGPVQQDAFFAPTTQTPYTDDLTLGYAVDLGRNMAFESNYTYRRTRDILEDYDLGLYALATDGTTTYPGPVDHPDSLWLGLDYFGYSENPGSNFVIATLAGGERNYQGVDLIFRKRYSDNWQMMGSYTYNWAEGNTNSDSNADFQGDDIYLDPRAPNQYARQPGLIPHVFKAAGSYMLNMGLEFGAAYRWNAGTLASKTRLASSRNLPIFGPQFEYAGFLANWIPADTVGSLENPSWGQFDLRVQYKRPLAGRVGAEFFVDIFNVFDNQDSIRNEDLVAGSGGTAFGEPIRFNDPRRFFLGTRVTF
jgi:Carboxypeptidase regulatory-like domain